MQYPLFRENYDDIKCYVNLIREDVSAVGCYISRCTQCEEQEACYYMGCFYNGQEPNGTIYTAGQITKSSCKYWSKKAALSARYKNLCAPSGANLQQFAFSIITIILSTIIIKTYNERRNA